MDQNTKDPVTRQSDQSQFSGPSAASRLPARDGLFRVPAQAGETASPPATPPIRPPATPLAGGEPTPFPRQPTFPASPPAPAPGLLARVEAAPEARTVSLARPAPMPLVGAIGAPLRPVTPLAGGPAAPLRPAGAPRPPTRAGVVYRGLPEPIRIVGWVAIAIVIGAVIGATAPTAFDRIAAVAAVQPGLLAWYCVRALGFLAYLVLAGSVLYGLLLSTKILDVIAHRPVSFALHKDLAIVALILGTLHGAMLTLDQSFNFTPLSLLVPFASPYSPISVGVGQLTLYVSAVVTASFYVRRHIGQRTWRLIHYLTFLAFIGSSAHGIFSGSDSGTSWAFWVYVLPVTAAVFLTTYRIVLSVAARSSRTERAVTPGVGLVPRGPLDRPGAASGGSPWPL